MLILVDEFRIKLNAFFFLCISQIEMMTVGNTHCSLIETERTNKQTNRKKREREKENFLFIYLNSL